MGNLYDAHNQWVKRPPDERFWNIDELITATRRYKELAFIGHTSLAELKFTSKNNDLLLEGKTGVQAQMGHYSFNQLTRLLGAPSEYLRELPTGIAGCLLNLGVAQHKNQDRGMALLMQRTNGDITCRAALSESYTRIWDCDLASRIKTCLHNAAGWRTPPARPAFADIRARPATADDLCKSSHVQLGEMISPAGLYASEKDMFLTFIQESNPINIHGNNYFRGCTISNSEVGDRKNEYSFFFYSEMCGNHIFWNVPWVQNISIIHRSDADDRAMLAVERDLNKFAQMSTEQDTDLIHKAQAKLLGNTSDDVVNTLWKERLSGITQGEIRGAVAIAATPEYEADLAGASPRSVWGVVQGITRLSQKEEYMDKRVKLDRVAGRVLEMAF